MKTKLTLITAFAFFSMSLMAQVEKDMDITLSFGPAITKIKNKNITEDKFKVIDNKNGANASFCFNKYFSRIGFGIGLGYSSFNQVVLQKGKFESFSRMDKDGNIYDE